MEEGLFLDRIHMHSDRLAVIQALQLALAVPADAAEADLAGCKDAGVGAEQALHLAAGQAPGI